ncbi:hypothetical protein [Paenibacillus camelliae]|uniref:hypothetical protein n=1 Tax=Paenibacillus camelliae TaxID=512410 RepID=UPI00203FFBF5|nr:hypothetical protein [Paenibacillus camelliae]MCM3632926.1 hypothetical protein [Paenibacillus camelliae]
MYETSIGRSKISFSPVNELEEIEQNLVTLISTAAGSVPLDRSLGIDMSALDKPMEIASALIVAAAIDAIETYEPRAVVKSVTTTFDADGRLVPVVRWEPAGEVST